MTTNLDYWNEELEACTSCSTEFKALYSTILSRLQHGEKYYWGPFFKKIKRIIMNQNVGAPKRFHALYLLFISTETCSSNFGVRFAEEPELISFIYNAARNAKHDGKFFFSYFPSPVQEKYGMRFVTLSMECIVIWNHNFAKLDRKDSHIQFGSYFDSLRSEKKLPSSFYFIGRMHYSNAKMEQNQMTESIKTKETLRLLKGDAGILNSDSDDLTPPSSDSTVTVTPIKSLEELSRVDTADKPSGPGQKKVQFVLQDSPKRKNAKEQPKNFTSKSITIEFEPDMEKIETLDEHYSNTATPFTYYSHYPTCGVSPINGARAKTYPNQINGSLDEIQKSINKSRDFRAVNSRVAKSNTSVTPENHMAMSFQKSHTMGASRNLFHISRCDPMYESANFGARRSSPERETNTSSKGLIEWSDGSHNEILTTKPEQEEPQRLNWKEARADREESPNKARNTLHRFGLITAPRKPVRFGLHC